MCRKRLTFLYTSPYEHVQYNIIKLFFKKCLEKIYLYVYFFYNHRRCWPTFIQYLPTMYLVQRMWAYPSNSGSMLDQSRSPVLVQCRSIVYDADPIIIHQWVCCILCASTWHSSNAVLILTHSLQRWPDIEIALGDLKCFLTAALLWG